MRTAFALFVFVWLVCMARPVSTAAGELYGSFSLAADVLSTHADFSDAFDLDERAGIGFVCEAARPGWPVSIVAGYYLSYGQARTTENPCGLKTGRAVNLFCSETAVGIKRTLYRRYFVKPYISGGVSSLNMYADISYDHEYEGAYGCWYGAGADVTISDTWQIRLGWRRSRVKMKLFGNRLDAGGDHFDLSIGCFFPPKRTDIK